MREIEFKKLEPGDIVYNSGQKDDPWTVVSFFSRHDTFLLVQGRHEVSERTRRFWWIMTLLPDKLILDLAEHMDLRIGRIFDPQKWDKETPSLPQSA